MVSILRVCLLAVLLFHCTARAARKSNVGPSKASKVSKKSKVSKSSESVDIFDGSISSEGSESGVAESDGEGFKGYKISVITWNLAEKSPSKKDYSFLQSYQDDDIVVIGAQECEDVRPRREEGHRSRAWKKLQKASLGKSFTCVANHRMGGLQIAVYAKKNVAAKIQGTQILDVACGVGNVLTNKGAVCVLLRMKGKTLALINAHLAAHVGKVIRMHSFSVLAIEL